MEQRIAKLEKTVEQQGKLLLVMMVMVIVATAGMLWLWGERGKPNFDHIAVSLTIFQMMFATAAVFGFWALRGTTREKAAEVAADEARSVAQEYFSKENKTKTKEGDKTPVPAHNPRTNAPSPFDVSTEGASEETGATDD